RIGERDRADRHRQAGRRADLVLVEDGGAQLLAVDGQAGDVLTEGEPYRHARIVIHREAPLEADRDTPAVDNGRIADRLEAFASLLELSEANPYTARAYRRAAETIRSAPVPVDELVRTRRVRQLRGIGAGIEARLRELVETGDIEELAELERELAPGLVGLGRYLGLSTRRSME